MKKNLAITMMIMGAVFFLFTVAIAEEEGVDTNYFSIKIIAANEISTEKNEIIRSSSIATLSGIVRFFTKKCRIKDIEELATVNGLNWSKENYIQNSKELWLYKGMNIKIPRSFLGEKEKVSQNQENSAEKAGEIVSQEAENMERLFSPILPEKPMPPKNLTVVFEKSTTMEIPALEIEEADEALRYLIQENSLLKEQIDKLKAYIDNLETRNVNGNAYAATSAKIPSSGNKEGHSILEKIFSLIKEKSSSPDLTIILMIIISSLYYIYFKKKKKRRATTIGF